MNKKGIELSVNFIIAIIIAIVVLILGIYLFSGIGSTGKGLAAKVTADMEKKVNRILINTDEIIAVPTILKELEKGEVAHFAVGIRADTSKCGGGSSATFTVGTRFDIAVDQNNQEQTSNVDIGKIETTWQLNPRQYEVKNRKREVIDVPLKLGPEAELGWTYVFDLGITCDGQNSYDGYAHKLYLVAK